MDALLRILASGLFYSLACAQDSAADPGFDIDPYLQYRPPFARSLPVQILLTGVVLTLVAVLFIHLIFTAQYHWPLAPVNYVLQLSGVTSLLISLIATLQVVLAATFAESEKWPYMLSYIAVNVPPVDLETDTDEWNIAERATWLVMNASTSGLIQITHIQFLTLLYPSRLEGRLIFALLGPLAIVAAVMQLLPIHDSAQVISIASAVRNVCNATLSLLFTAALFIWGLLVNRKQAWRTDGGTAAFGAAALTLAVVSTALNFLYVPREEEYVWLPSLMWAVILWQSFLGWWWWVGAGSGGGLTGEDDGIVEKMKRKEEREARRKEARERRRETKQKAKKVWTGVAGAFVTKSSSNRQQPAHRNPPSNVQQQETSSPPASFLDPPPELLATPAAPPSTVSSSTSSADGSFSTLPRLLPAIVHRWYASLRHAHVVAARQQAAERVERIRELERNENANARTTGWGLGSFGWRIGSEGPVSPEWERQNRGGWSTRHRSRPDSPCDKEHKEQTVGDLEDPHRIIPQLPPSRPAAAARGKSLWWWGPLSRWRLQDSTSY